MAERTPAVKKYRDALETVINATEEFMSRDPQKDASPAGGAPRDADHEVVQSLLGLSSQHSPEVSHRNKSFNPGPQMGGNEQSSGNMQNANDYMPNYGNSGAIRNHIPLVSDPMFEAQRSALWENANGMTMPQGWAGPSEGGGSARMGEGLMDPEWLLSLCEGDGFSLQMLNEIIRFEPGAGASVG
jgi:hypothetical protein